MADYIDREATIKAFDNFDAGRAAGTHSALLTPEELAEYLYELPAADVEPVRHGKWIPIGCSPTTVRLWRDRHGVLTRRYWHGCQETCPDYCPYGECLMPAYLAGIEDDEERARKMQHGGMRR